MTGLPTEMSGTASGAVFTIVSKNYLHYARTLMHSVREVHADWDRYVLLVDEIRGDFDPAGEDFTFLEVRQLPLPDMNQFLFRYSILELNTAVKPWMFEWLFANCSYNHIVYLDPDIYLYQPMKEVESALADGSLMVLTPHLTGPLNDGNKPDELDIMRSGTYNLGFIALSRHPEYMKFLHWWQNKLEFQCVIDFESGLFVDQKWIDLVPGMYPDVVVLRHEGYNVAYWNLLHRKLELAGERVTVNGVPLVFCHFSGIDPQNPQTLSKYQNRFKLTDLPEFSRLALEYCKKVIANGMEECRTWQYAYGHFSDGTPIEDYVRYCYRTTAELREIGGSNPFDKRGKLVSLAQSPHVIPLTTVMRKLWEQRPELQRDFPDIEGRDRLAYAKWFVAGGAAGSGIPDELIVPVRQSLIREVGSLSPMANMLLRLTYRVGPKVVNLFPYRFRQFVKAKIYPGSDGRDSNSHGEKSLTDKTGSSGL